MLQEEKAVFDLQTVILPLLKFQGFFFFFLNKPALPWWRGQQLCRQQLWPFPVTSLGRRTRHAGLSRAKHEGERWRHVHLPPLPPLRLPPVLPLTVTRRCRQFLLSPEPA